MKITLTQEEMKTAQEEMISRQEQLKSEMKPEKGEIKAEMTTGLHKMEEKYIKDKQK